MKAALVVLICVCGVTEGLDAVKPGLVDTMAIAHAHLDFWNGLTDGSFIHAHDVSVADEVNMKGKPIKGLAGLLALRDSYHTAFGDLTFHTDDVVAGALNSKNEFLMSWNASGTHTGDFSGIKPVIKGMNKEYYGVTRMGVNKEGTKIIRMDIMHGTFILEQIGMYNHLVVDTQSMTDEWMSFWNHKTDDVSHLVTQDFKIIDNMNMKGVNAAAAMEGVEGLNNMRALYKAAFSDMNFPGKAEVTHMVGDKFISTWTFRGTNDGELMGIPPTGVHIDHPGANIFIMKGGKIAECRIIHSKHMWTELGLFHGMKDTIEL